MENKLTELFERGITKDGYHFDFVVKTLLSEFSARARKKKRIYKRKKADPKPTA